MSSLSSQYPLGQDWRSYWAYQITVRGPPGQPENRLSRPERQKPNLTSVDTTANESTRILAETKLARWVSDVSSSLERPAQGRSRAMLGDDQPNRICGGGRVLASCNESNGLGCPAIAQCWGLREGLSIVRIAFIWAVRLLKWFHSYAERMIMIVPRVICFCSYSLVMFALAPHYVRLSWC